MRSAIGGWVLNSLPMPPPRNGLAIISELVGASDGSSTSGRAAVPRSSLRSALASASGSPVTWAPVASAGVLAAAADRHLDDAGGERAEDDQRQARQHVAALAVAPAEQHRQLREVGQERDDGRERGGDRADEDVAVADVRELVAEHAAQLALVEQLEDALGDADGGVLRVAARSRRRSARAWG